VVARKQFPKKILTALDTSKIIGVRAGSKPHRFIGVWAIVVRERVFVRPWNNKPAGWYQAFLKEPQGVIQLEELELNVHARRVRGERLLDAIDLGYRSKYPTPGSRNYVEGFARAERRATTLELLPG
jgi:hypothetical protein